MKSAAVDTAPLWPPKWVFLVRLGLYLVIGGFFLQQVYFGTGIAARGRTEQFVLLAVMFCCNFALLLPNATGSVAAAWNVLGFVLDIALLSRIIALTGGFNSILLPYLFPFVVVASAFLPRRYTALFPSVAILGVVYMGVGHFAAGNAGLIGDLETLYGAAIQRMGTLPLPEILSNILVLSAILFTISYFAGMLSDRWSMEQRINRDVLSTMRDGVAVLDRRGKVLYFNSEFARLFPGNEVTNLLQEIFPGLEPDRFMDTLPDEVRAGSFLVIREADQATSTPAVEIKASLLGIARRPATLRLVILASDITMRQRMERVERELAHYSSISAMAAGLAHEIRNPLASVRSAMQEIGSSFDPASDQRALADVVMRESDRLDGVITRFLSFSREEEIRPIKCSLSGILENIRALILRDARFPGLQMTLTVESEEAIVADPDRLHEVFLNLSLNAAEFAPRDGGVVSVALARVANDGIPGMQVLVTDNGPGISDEDAERLFEPFFTRRPGGTGLGLSLARKQILLHGGEISLQRTGAGACFRIWLPLTRAPRGTHTTIIRKNKGASVRWK